MRRAREVAPVLRSAAVGRPRSALPLDGGLAAAGPAAVAWQVTVPIDGTLRQVWNAVATSDGSGITATGVDWNRVIMPGGEAAVGFCADRLAPIATATPAAAAAWRTYLPSVARSG